MKKWVLMALAMFSSGAMAATSIVVSDKTNRVYVHYSQPSAKFATVLAMNDCRKETDDCRVLVEVESLGWFGVSVCPNKSFIFVYNGSTKEEAVEAMVVQAVRKGFKLSTCKVIGIELDNGGRNFKST